MLIRSQDGGILTPIENISGLCIVKKVVKNGYEEAFDNGHVKIMAITTKMDWDLAEYSSDEKAKRVLDMLGELYQKEDNFIDSGHGLIGLPSHKIFKMPQDSEVVLNSTSPRYSFGWDAQ